MSELGETFKMWGEHNKKKKAKNKANSLEILKSLNVEFKFLSEDHLRVGEYDFWPSTGLFIHRKTKIRGRGVRNLIKKVSHDKNLR